MKRFLIILSLLVLLVVLGAAGWAVNAFVYFGPEFPRRDYLGDVIRDAAQRLDVDPNDHRMSDSFELIYKKYLEIEKDELGLREIRKSDIIGRPVMTSVLYDEFWYVPERHPPETESGRLFPTTYHQEGWEESRVVAERLQARFDEEGMTELVDTALSLPGYIPSANELRNRVLHSRAGLHTAAQVEHLRAQQGVLRGDFEAVLQSVNRLAQIREYFLGYPAAHAHDLACRVDTYICNIIRSVVSAGGADSRDLELLADAIPFPREDVLAEVIEYKRAYSLDALQGVFRQGALLKRDSFDYHAHRINTWTDRFVVYSTASRNERQALVDPVGHPDGDIVNWVEEWNDMPSQFRLPFFSTNIRVADANSTMLHGHRLLLALERYKERYGTYPESLQAIDLDLESAGIVDVYAASGKFCYQKYENPDEYSREYVLYSVGVDGQDDGGVYHYLQLTDERHTHGDYIFNPQPFNDWDAYTEYSQDNAN